MTNDVLPAVEVAGFLRSGLGLGEAARLYVEALEAAGVPVHTTTVDIEMPTVVDSEGRTARKKTVEFEDVEHAGDLPVSLICVNAPELAHFRAQVGDGFFDRARNIGSWAWEVDKVPQEWLPMFGYVDEIWVYSHFVAHNLADAASVPVVRVPLPIVEPTVDGPPPDFGLPEKFTFLFMFDFFSTLQRKNPLGLISAFTRAFAPGEGPQLVLKSFNGDYKPERLAEVRRAAAGHPDIHIVDRYVTGREKDALVAACDCYVSLHRAEGFGLTLGEAMVLGKPVIATGFSGNTDFMTPENSYLVDWQLTTVGEGGENYPADGHWAEPDLDHAAATMREVWEGADQARERGAAAQAQVREEWSLEAVGRIARERLDQVAELSLREGTRTSGPRFLPRPPGALEGAEQKLTYDPRKDAADSGARGAHRRLALQAMRPYTHHQDEINQLLVKAVRETSDRLDDLTREMRARWRGIEDVLDQAGIDEGGSLDVRRTVRGARARPASSHPAITRELPTGEVILAFERGDGEDGLADIGFDDIFRGSETLIRERQREYIRMLRDSEWVLDLGCGRGEFLDLLQESEIRGRGIDLDAEMVARCRAKGHEAEVADAVEYMKQLEPSSVPAVFAAQVIEHLPSPALKGLLELTAARLVPGGIAIFETVNPHCASAMKAFWTDPTHQHPLFPEVVLALARLAGFQSGRVHFPGGAGRFEEQIYTNPDYAVVLRTRS
jgi:glycosyltransferase involved in cell wall biosynthesis/SAM-dependent methyltransferase